MKISKVKGNEIWAITSPLVWKQLMYSVVKEDIALLDQGANKEANYFNKSPYYSAYFDDNDKLHQIIDVDSFYVGSGYGKETAEIINMQWKNKFPKCTFPDIRTDLSDIDIVALAYMYKNLEYPEKFNKTKLYFNDEALVKAFEVKDIETIFQVHPVKYQNSDRFIVMLDTKSPDDVIYLSKGYELYQIETPFVRVPTDEQSIQSIDSNDKFICPCVSFDEQLDSLKCFQGHIITNKTVPTGAIITETHQRVKFNMDEIGTSVQSVAQIFITGSSIFVAPETKFYIFDKPYYIIMAKRGQKIPYFVAKINNTQFMIKEEEYVVEK